MPKTLADDDFDDSTARTYSDDDFGDGDREEDTVIKDGIKAIVAAIGSIKLTSATKEHTPCPAPQVTVNVPKRGSWSATVAERDKDGFIKRVEFREVATS